MAEFNVSAVLKADASSMVAGTQAAASANDRLVASAAKAGAALAEEGAASEAAAAAHATVEQSTGNVSAAQAILQAAIRKTTDQFAAGAPISTIFAEHIESVVEATELAGGSLGKVGEFLSGPWGIAISAGVSVLSILIPKLFEASDASDDLKKSQADLASFLDRTTGKVKEQISYLALLGKSSDAATKQQSAYQSYQTARSGFITGVDQLATPTSISERGLPGMATGAGLQGDSLAKVNKIIADYGQGLINITEATKRFNAEAANDKALQAIAPQFVKLAQSVDSASTASNAATVELARIAVAAGTASDAQKRIVAANTEGVKADTALAEARARLATASGSVAKAEAALALYEEAHRKEAEAGGQAYADYEANVTRLSQAVTDAKNAQEAARQATHDHNAELRDAAAAARAAAAADRELDSALASVIGKYDPATKAVTDYAAALQTAAAARDAGKIGAGEEATIDAGVLAVQLKAQTDRFNNETAGGEADYKQIIADMKQGAHETAQELLEGSKKAAQQFQQDGERAAKAIGDLLGGKIGGVVGTLTGFLSGQGPAGAIDKFLGDLSHTNSDGSIALDTGSVDAIGGKFTAGLQQFLGGDSEIAKVFRTGLSGLAEGLAAAGLVGDSAGNKLGGAIGGVLGKSLGANLVKEGLTSISSSLGSLAGPLAGALGGLVGSVLGGLFGKVKTGGATIGSVDGAATISGNSASQEKVASGIATSVQDGLQQIADQLGGGIGSFGNITVGTYNGKYRVQTDGTHLGGANHGEPDAVDFGKDGQADAIAFAIQTAVSRGAVTGLDAAVQKALASSTDLNKSLQEALGVEQLETALGGLQGSMQATIKATESTAANNLDLARKYGLDINKVEALNEKNRLATIQSIVDSQVGSLKDLQASLSSGDLFEGSAADKLDAIKKDIASALDDFANGVSGAADRLSTDYQNELSTAKDAYGTAGSEYAGVYDDVQTSITNLIAQTTQQAKDAANAVDQQLGLANENNDLVAAGNATLTSINTGIQAIAGSLGGGTTTISRGVARTASL